MHTLRRLWRDERATFVSGRSALVMTAMVIAFTLGGTLLAIWR